MVESIHFETGSVVSESGIYRVIHAAHRLPHEVTLLTGGTFPRCSKCADLVTFELVRAAPAMFQYEPLHLYELPVVEEDEANAAEAS